MGEIVRCGDGLHGAEPAHGLKSFTAAAAAVAHEGGIFTHVFAHLDQVIVVRHRQDIFCLRFVDRPRVAAVLSERTRNVAKSQTSFHGSAELAGDAQVVILVAAEAGADADKISLLDYAGRPLVVQNMVGLFCHENGFIDKDPSELSVHTKEEVLDEILLHVYILIKEFAQVFLVYIASGAHQGKLEKADHRRRQYEFADTVVIGVDKEPLFTKMVKKFFGLGL